MIGHQVQTTATDEWTGGRMVTTTIIYRTDSSFLIGKRMDDGLSFFVYHNRIW